ncbi:MAG: tRNA 2-thiouridine(34) synthase MnmA [Bacteroidota bacterium]|nr:tRNA 2-thiouridine(34) synthase MnmA [Bacteroidota bacterium]
MKKILLAMSGGTDSSVSAMILQQAGYTIEGISFKMWENYHLSSCDVKDQGCCNAETLLEARELAKKLNFPHNIIDIRDEFDHYVIQNFISEYKQGRTPNPCVVCNTHIKWGILLDEMEKMGHTKYATGHYARIREENGRYILKRGVDLKKDQSYFLWTLNQKQLSHTIFPLGEFTKAKVREIARDNGFEGIAGKKESQEICFIPDNDYRRFLRDAVPGIEKTPGEGWFVDKHGKKLGKHKGFPFYTIGQRRGLNIALGYPAYVISIDAKNNTIVLGESKELQQNELNIKNCNWIKYPQPPTNTPFDIKIRYNTAPVSGQIKAMNKNGCHIVLEKPVHAITAGQSAVLYEGDNVVGGGVICQ